MFVIVAFLIFTAALLAAGYYVWSIPQQRSAEALAGRLRDLRVRGGGPRRALDLVRRERRGAFAFLGDFVAWIGVLRRLQTAIDQADMRYRAADVAAVTLVITALAWLALGVFGLPLAALRLLAAAALGSLPIAYILRVRAARLKKFEETFPDAIDLFNRSMKAGHTIHS
ncbi:MAG: hypothetical protein ACRD44_05105, partial [Bryobacteraceae bacterium]